MTRGDPGRRTDVAMEAITADLGRVHARRRRRFAPALAFVAVLVVGTLAGLGLRANLWDQPPWQVALQIATWLVCLVLFPAVGVGLWFPRPLTRVALAVGGVSLAIEAATGWPAAVPSTHAPRGDGPCWMVLGGFGLLLLGIGALAGAFAERRSHSATYWVAAGVALAALNAVTWVCPDGNADHVIRLHLGPSLIVVAIAVGVGLFMHHRANAR